MIVRFFPDSRLVAAILRAQEQWQWHVATLAERISFRNGPQPAWPFRTKQVDSAASFSAQPREW